MSYGGSKIHYEHLEQAIRTLDINNEINRDRFALYKSADDSSLEFWIEANSDEAYDALTADIDSFQHRLVDEVAKSNTDFRKILEGNSNPYPNIKVFKYQESPMSLHAIKNPHRKLQRVVVGNEELDTHLTDFPDSFTGS